ncbi:GGDEF domain-containing protein [Thauera sinica]|uniref:Diguanylate cyclase domain-containing protein n=1 Tax=Thauera sinica TaxID=2665146 RepID=A0ABW1AZI5_9RHOO|nr:GGDEF domain-containing protein [Thauera sp. K11]
MTGLPNRELLHDRLREAMAPADRHRRRFAALIVDLDYFERVNDTLGHAAGGELLVEAGCRMACCVRASDTVARLGGDEFALILQEVRDTDEIDEVARRLCAMLEQPFELADGPAQVTSSAGIALYPEHGEDAETLLRHADGALYQAKRAGRGRYRLHAPPAARTDAEPENQ